jgi:excisionase family DNA binding protein
MTIEALLLSARDSATLLGISDRTCRELIYQGHIESVQIGTRRLVPIDALRTYIQRLRATT